MTDLFKLANRTYASRLLVGTGKYKDLQETEAAIKASGAEIVTVALRRVDMTKKGEGSLHEVLTRLGVTILPNTAACYTAEEAVRTLKLARELGGWNLVKLEVIGDKTTLFPDVVETLKAAQTLVADGFDVMAYTSDDPVVARELEKIGCCAVMPLGSWIGSGHGILNPRNIREIVENANVPILVDAGIGTASEAAQAMELGCAGVLMNTAIAAAQNPVQMASAMKLAVEAGREAFLAGRMEKRDTAQPSSPTVGVVMG